MQPRAVVLVEGESDRAALSALAARRGLDLAGTDIVAMGGATNIGHFLDRYAGVPVGGLCDAAEEGFFRRALERAGLGSDLTRDAMEDLGFFVCDADLEDELIRALGVAAVEEVVAAQGELRSFRLFQRQPAQHGRSTSDQLHRFLGTRSGRKGRYGRLLVEALDLTGVPRPLDRVLAVRGRARGG